MLAICTLEPLLSGQRARPGANIFLILADNSQSLTIKDPGVTATRGEKVKTLLNAEEEPWQVRLAQDFDLRRYVFDSRLQNVADFSHLQFSGSQSEHHFQSPEWIGKIDFEIDRWRECCSSPMGSQRMQNDVEFQPEDSLPPIYPVVMGLNRVIANLADLAVSHVTVTATAFEDAPVTIQADVTRKHHCRSQKSRPATTGRNGKNRH